MRSLRVHGGGCAIRGQGGRTCCRVIGSGGRGVLREPVIPAVDRGMVVEVLQRRVESEPQRNEVMHHEQLKMLQTFLYINKKMVQIF